MRHNPEARCTFAFYLSHFEEDDTPVGDLARDFFGAPQRPQGYPGHDAWRAWFQRQGASPEAMATFEQAWTDYQAILRQTGAVTS